MADVYRTSVRSLRQRYGSDVEHLVQPNHRYGASRERIWVDPICGRKSGQAMPGVGWSETCKRCEKIAAKRGYTTGDRKELNGAIT